jgi:hypothetical protein
MDTKINPQDLGVNKHVLYDRLALTSFTEQMDTLFGQRDLEIKAKDAKLTKIATDVDTKIKELQNQINILEASVSPEQVKIASASQIRIEEINKKISEVEGMMQIAMKNDRDNAEKKAIESAHSLGYETVQFVGYNEESWQFVFSDLKQPDQPSA